VAWVEIFGVFVVAHLVGDYLVQTDWQARHKRGGLRGDAVQRRALLAHVTTYTLVFVPVLVWLYDDLGAGVVAVAAAVFAPHLIQDDGRLVSWFLMRVKGCDERTALEVFTPVDQTFHLVTLFAIAVAAGG
jgi:hypothetical protein